MKIADLKKLLRKYPASKNIVEIDNIDNFKVLKGYLLQKKIRTLVFLRGRNDNFIPIAIVKKESKKGENIIKINYHQFFKGEIMRVFEDLGNGDFEVEEV